MSIRFADTAEGRAQDRVYGILLSLTMIIDTARLAGSCSGESYWAYQQAVKYHYQRAVYDTLRLLGTCISDDSIASEENVEHICLSGHPALMEIIERHKDQFNGKDA